MLSIGAKGAANMADKHLVTKWSAFLTAFICINALIPHLRGILMKFLFSSLHHLIWLTHFGLKAAVKSNLMAALTGIEK
jgi:hypothetical protein